MISRGPRSGFFVFTFASGWREVAETSLEFVKRFA